MQYSVQYGAPIAIKCLLLLLTLIKNIRYDTRMLSKICVGIILTASLLFANGNSQAANDYDIFLADIEQMGNTQCSCHKDKER